MSIETQRYTVRFVPSAPPPDPLNDNVDVKVTFDSGESYVATFFTLENLASLMEKNRRTGECLDGFYLWASDMIIVERITLEDVSRAVADLLASGEFRSAFSGPHRPEPDEHE